MGSDGLNKTRPQSKMGCPIRPEEVGDNEVGMVTEAEVELGELYVLGVEWGWDFCFNQDCCTFQYL